MLADDSRADALYRPAIIGSDQSRVLVSEVVRDTLGPDHVHLRLTKESGNSLMDWSRD